MNVITFKFRNIRYYILIIICYMNYILMYNINNINFNCYSNFKEYFVCQFLIGIDFSFPREVSSFQVKLEHK